jgi:hypothetical protein
MAQIVSFKKGNGRENPSPAGFLLLKVSCKPASEVESCYRLTVLKEIFLTTASLESPTGEVQGAKTCAIQL